MPSGIVHYHYYKIGYLVEIPLTLFFGVLDFQFGFGNLCGYTFHRWCDNDLDLMGTSSAEGRQVNELPIIGHIMFGISSTYGSIFRKFHRHFFTHFPFISTSIRLIFFFTLPALLLDYWGINFLLLGLDRFYWGFWFGLSQADALHYILDITYGD